MSRPTPWCLLALALSTQGCRGTGSTPAVTPPGADDSGGPSPSDDTGGGVEHVPGGAEPWLRKEVVTPGPVTFTELHYHAPDQPDLEWIELHNPMVLDLDISGWSLEGGVGWTFPRSTVLPAGGYLVIAADPGLLEEQSGYAEALGPYSGRLDNKGERIELISNGGRLIDTIEYGVDEPWAVAADGSGWTLAKADPDAASDHAENWTVSLEQGGTPGAANGLDPHELPTLQLLIAEDATWSYEVSGSYPAADWAELDFDDSGWPGGQAPFYAGDAVEDVLGTAWITADNYFAAYLGRADGSDLRLVGEDSDGSWTTVEELDLELSAQDHLYLAAWELTGDSSSPQMIIGEVELPDDSAGTDASAWEWVLGPAGDNPGALPGQAPPSEAEIQVLVEDAEAFGSWELPAVEAGRSSSPWGGSVGSAFTGAASFIWADTFDSDSLTNSEDTYALFRSVDPIVGARGNVELTDIPTTVLFRTPFSFAGSPGRTELHLDCELDDGAVFWLNGVEVHRQNMPEGDVDAETLAADEIVDNGAFSVVLPGGSLEQGTNVLAVEVHQAAVDDTDLLFGCTLIAETWSEARQRTVVFNEVPAAEEASWVELLNLSDEDQDLDGLVLFSSSGEELTLSAAPLGPGALLVLDDLDLDVEDGDRLFLRSADGRALLDGVAVGEAHRARASDGGPWRVPTAPSPGEPNLIELTEDVVIHELMFHRAPRSEEGGPVTPRDEEWIELYNRGEVDLDLSGWRLVDAVSFAFPEGTTLAAGQYLLIAADAEALGAAHPDLTVLGNYVGSLSNSSDRVLLLDAVGNPADEVRYFDGGLWPAAADGGGSSLELRDPWADNATAAAWAASDESPRAEWTEVIIRGEAGSSSVGPDGVWEELVLGLLDAGEVLIDDLSVIQDPDGAAIELVANGSFDGGTDHWRLLGTHRHSEVVPDPDDPGNSVLAIKATGPTGHMHDHLETTLLWDIDSGEHQISFRARWVSGSNQLHSRLYFNRLATTTLVPQPEHSGTPGAANSTGVDNLGPTMSGLRQGVAVPDADEPVLITVSAHDPDGLEEVSLWSSVDGGAFEELPMSEAGGGTWEAELPGQPAGSLVQLYVEATDSLGASATFPAAGPESRALYMVDDGQGRATGLHDFRLLMTEDDLEWLHEDVNLMSNDLVGATVVYGESEVFYDVGVRLKGSQRGRPSAVRLGYGVRFGDDQPFRGSHTSVMLDRSEGVNFGQREVLMNLMMTRAGSVSGEYNDLVQLIAPRSEYTGSAELQLDRFSNLVLDAQFEDGSRGTRFEYELIYYPYTTEDGQDDGLKLPQPDLVVGASITELGESREDYRWIWLIKNNARTDDYDGIMDLCRVSSLSSEAYLEEADEVIDVEQWLRAFAMSTLSGATDQYGGAGSQHNAQFYVRPSDGRVLFFPHDLDYFGSASMAVVGNSDLARLLQDPGHKRSYYGHLNDIIEQAYNPAYLAPWCAQLGALLPDQDFEAHCDFIEARVAYVQSGSSSSVLSVFPEVEFAITTEGGEDFEVEGTEVSLEGEAWVDVREIRLDGAPEGLAITWLDETRWRVTVLLEEGVNDVVLVATDLHGEEVGRDAVVVTAAAGS